MRAGLKAVLAPQADLEVVGEAQDGEEALSRCRELGPDLVLMDVAMPKRDGIEATRLIKAEFPRTSVLVVTARDDEQFLMDAITAGAAGYILKNAKPRHLLDAIRAVFSGETPFDQRLAARLLRRLAQEAALRTRSQTKSATGSSHDALARPLTPREAEVLGHLADGKTNRQVAQDLYISLSTAKRHVESIISKLGVSDRTQAVVRAIELDVLPVQRSKSF